MAAPPLRDAVLRMVLYFDIFSHPVTLGDLERLCRPGDRAAVERAVRALEAEHLIETRGACCFRPGRAETVARRQERAAFAEQAWPRARQAAAALARLPWVRGLVVTGSLSKNSTTPGGDVDFMVLVAPGRVWMLKTLLQGLRRGLPERARELLCTNYLLSTDDLAIPQRNLFTAVELATAVPVAGRSACVALLRENPWAARFVPGLSWSVERARNLPPDPPRPPGHRVESLLDGLLGERAEGAALGLWDRYWNRKYGWLDDAVRARRFRRDASTSTNHLHDFQGYVLREARRRFDEAGLAEPVELP